MTKTWEATALVTISVTARIEADTEEEARDIAASLGVPSLCAYCNQARNAEYGGEWTVGELDGEPQIERVEVAP